MKTKLVLISVWHMGKRHAMLTRLPVGHDGKVRLTPRQYTEVLKHFEKTKKITLGTGQVIALGV